MCGDVSFLEVAQDMSTGKDLTDTAFEHCSFMNGRNVLHQLTDS
jgi:hypothetical protein